jgi:hypothetical protein
MATNGVTTPVSKPPSEAAPRHKFFVSGLVVRLLIAFVISWLIIMVFFVTTVASR